MVNRHYSSTASSTSLTGSITADAASMVVAATTGFPVSTPYTLVVDPGQENEEIVTVTNASGTTLDIERAEDGSSSTAHDAGAVVRHMLTARDLREPQEHIAAEFGVHGVTGDIVGTSDTQTLSNKTLVDPVVSGSLTGGTVNPTTLQQNGIQAVTTTGTQTLTNKTLVSPTISGGVLNPDTLQVGSVAVATTSSAQTLTNKTISGGSVDANSVAVSGTPVLTTSGTQTVTNKTISGASNTITNLPLSALPSRVVGEEEQATNVSIGGSATAVDSVTFTPVSGHRYEVRALVDTQAGGSNHLVQYQLREDTSGGTTLDTWRQFIAVSGGAGRDTRTFFCDDFVASSSSAKTFHLVALVESGASGATNTKCRLRVLDLGKD